MPESITEPSSSIKDENSACLGINDLLRSCLEISVTWAPEMRIIPTPPFPGGVAIAAMVSWFTDKLSRFFYLLGNVGLLNDRQCVINNPV